MMIMLKTPRPPGRPAAHRQAAATPARAPDHPRGRLSAEWFHKLTVVTI